MCSARQAEGWNRSGKQTSTPGVCILQTSLARVLLFMRSTRQEGAWSTSGQLRSS